MADEPAGKAGWWRVFHDKFVVEERYMDASARKALYITAGVLALVCAFFFFLTLTDVLE